jgi:methylated-DNA-[protein]-cysteine S-methyltransferase
MAIAGREDALVGVVFGRESRSRAERALARYLPGESFGFSATLPSWMSELTGMLTRYAVGERVDFSHVLLDLDYLTPLGRQVIAACRRIPAGSVRTYGELAADCGAPGAARAVGSVMAKNRYPLIVPCHRVVGAAGSLGGYSAPDGLRMKRRLLAMESCR